MSKHKILIIDDEPLDIEIFKESLQNEAYEIISAQNGEEGLKLYNALHPILVVLDLKMPKMDGFEFLNQLNLTPAESSSVIVLTGDSSDDEIEQCFNKDISAFIRKPFNTTELKGLIRNTISLNEVTAQRHQAEAELDRYRQNLEELVGKRTSQLLRSNKKLKQEIQLRKQSEQELREIEIRYNALFNQHLDCVYINDLEGNFIDANQAALNLLGYSREELLSLNYASLLNPTHLPVAMQNLEDLIRTGTQTALHEYQLTCKNGSPIHIETLGSLIYHEGEPQAMIGIARDITERKISEMALRESEEKYRLIYENSPLGVMRFDKDCIITDGNKIFAEIIGVPKNELKGINLLTSMKGSAQTAIKNTFKYGFGIFEGNYFAGNDEITVKTTTKAITTESGDFLGGIGILEDITEKRKIETQLQQAQKMKAVSVLAGGIAHQFNNALVGITGNVELLKMALPEEALIHKYTKPMKTAVNRMTGLTSQMLAYARGGKYQPQDLSLNTVIKETIILMQHRIGPDVQIVKDLPATVNKINADPAQIQMVIQAIIENALEAIENQGSIRIKTRNKISNGEIVEHGPDLIPGQYVSFVVGDDGKGMDSVTSERVFEPFFTTNFQGRGLGLSAVYGIVQNHKGSISIHSELDKGTTIEIYLPAIETKPEKTPETDTVITPGTGTILLIEDEKMVMDVSRSMLKNLGYSVLPATDGTTAVTTAETFDGKIDLAILDIGLPDMEGIDVFYAIKNARPNLKVIVCSGYSLDSPAREILKAGGYSFIQKPFTSAELSTHLKEALRNG